ncbi:MAG: hypothetical protein R2685_07825 [Candidatus Nitrosocosmicus sp.]|nr:hypothetical protein [Candidatus Nitrosocosmicus sp.]
MSSYNNNNTSNNTAEKNHLGYNDDDLKAKLEQIKANREARLQGKPIPTKVKQGPRKPVISVLGSSDNNNNNHHQQQYLPIEQVINLQEGQQQNEEQNQKKEEFNNPSTFSSPAEVDNNSSQGKDYSYYQSQIQSKFAQFQGERINEIAKLARKDKHEILLFKDQNINTDADNIPDDDQVLAASVSQQEYINQVCDRVVFRIKMVPNSVHVKLDELRAEIADLQRVKSLATSSVSEKGIVTPPQLVRNDPSVTGLTDQEFAKISDLITEKSEHLYKLMAFYYFGIGKKTYQRVETTSFTSAVEAGQYREQFGLVESSKNSGNYLTSSSVQ